MNILKVERVNGVPMVIDLEYMGAEYQFTRIKKTRPTAFNTYDIDEMSKAMMTWDPQHYPDNFGKVIKSVIGIFNDWDKDYSRLATK